MNAYISKEMTTKWQTLYQEPKKRNNKGIVNKQLTIGQVHWCTLSNF